MKNRLFLYIALGLAAAVSLSCKKKEEETTTKPGLYGLDFDIAMFARPGQEFTLKPYGVYTGDGKEIDDIVYKWKYADGEYEEKEIYTLKIGEVGNYTITCMASDPEENYYSTTASHTIIVIDPALGKTLIGTGIEADDDHISDSRDKTGENEYFYTHIGDLDWFRNNLAYKGAGVPYEEAEVTSYPLGRYYTWNEAQEACPEGWRLPTDEEWASLGHEAGALTVDAYLNSKRMWEYWPQIIRTNSTGLAIIPAGYVLTGDDPSFKRIYDYAAFWTATESETDPSMARYRYIYVKENEVRSTFGEKSTLALSVRCVR